MSEVPLYLKDGPASLCSPAMTSERRDLCSLTMTSGCRDLCSPAMMSGASGRRDAARSSRKGTQGYLTHKKTHPPRTLPQAYA